MISPNGFPGKGVHSPAKLYLRSITVVDHAYGVLLRKTGDYIMTLVYTMKYTLLTLNKNYINLLTIYQSELVFILKHAL